jgi:hypothetical protein
MDDYHRLRTSDVLPLFIMAKWSHSWQWKLWSSPNAIRWKIISSSKRRIYLTSSTSESNAANSNSTNDRSFCRVIFQQSKKSEVYLFHMNLHFLSSFCQVSHPFNLTWPIKHHLLIVIDLYFSKLKPLISENRVLVCHRKQWRWSENIDCECKKRQMKPNYMNLFRIIWWESYRMIF